MNRRNFIQTTGLSLASILISDTVLGFEEQREQLINYPDAVTAISNNQVVQLAGKGKQQWTYQGLQVNLKNTGKAIAIEIQAPRVELYAVTLMWKTAVKESSLILNDHWERTYGDVSWHQPAASEILPWYFIEHNGSTTNGFGVKTGAATFCYWQVNNGSLSFTMDTRSGGNAVELGDRRLLAAEIVTIKNAAGASASSACNRD